MTYRTKATLIHDWMLGNSGAIIFIIIATFTVYAAVILGMLWFDTTYGQNQYEITISELEAENERLIQEQGYATELLNGIFENRNEPLIQQIKDQQVEPNPQT